MYVSSVKKKQRAGLEEHPASLCNSSQQHIHDNPSTQNSWLNRSELTRSESNIHSSHRKKLGKAPKSRVLHLQNTEDEPIFAQEFATSNLANQNP